MSEIKRGDTVVSLKEITNGHRVFEKGEEFIVTYCSLSTIHLQSTLDDKPLICLPENFTLKKEEKMFDENKLVSGTWIVGSIGKQTERMSISATPKIHGSRGSAIAEARRLAVKDSTKKFVALKLDGIARATEVVVE